MGDNNNSELQEVTEEIQVNSHSQEQKDIEKVTDYMEEAEVDANKVNKAIDFLTDFNKKRVGNRTMEQKNDLNKDDIDVIMNELLVTKIRAERALREKQGNVSDALMLLINEKRY